jgi:hypothetical protein
VGDEYPKWMKVQSDEFGEIDMIVQSAAEAEAIAKKRVKFKVTVSQALGKVFHVVPLSKAELDKLIAEEAEAKAAEDEARAAAEIRAAEEAAREAEAVPNQGGA